MSNSTTPVAAEQLPAHVLEAIVRSLIGMRFGQVTVIVHDGRVIQIDRTERQRFAGEQDRQS